MKLSKTSLKVLASACALAMAFAFAGCKDEDENDALSGYSISYGHPSDSTTTYSRSWNVTHTPHVSADCTITIDRVSKTTKGTKDLTTTTDDGNGGTGNNTAYIFGLKGSGKEADPYSFGLCGFRLKGTTPQYFISYYTGVLSTDCNTDQNDFDTDSNTAYEYIVKSAWTDLPSNAYTLTSDALTIYVDLDAMSGSTVVTAENYKDLKGSIDTYRLRFFSSSTATTAGVTKEFSASDVTKDTYSGSKVAPDLEAFNIDQERLGFYAMVKKDCALVSSLDFNNDTIVKAATAGATDDFGKEIDIFGEVLTNIR